MSTLDIFLMNLHNLLYQKLSVLASEKGIGIIKDMILNHIGSEHWWMSDLPTQDWINNGAKFKISSHNHQSVHDPYISENEKKDFTDGWFDRTMPDLNQSNPYLAKYLVQNSIWWIEYANLSGFRVDTYPYIDKKFLSMWGERIINEYPNFSFVGEEWSNDPSMVAYWQRGSKRYDSYVSYVPCMMDFPLQQALINALLSKESWNSGLIDIYKILASDYVYGNPYDLVVFAGNHDIKRIYSQLNKKIELLKMAMGFILTTRGIPQIYYGTEIAMQSSKDHGDIRSDFPGGWKGDKSNAFNSKGLKSWELEAQDYLKRLLKWRGKSEAVTKGSLIHYKPSDGLYTYFRLFNNEVVMVIVNNNKDKKFLDLERFKDILKGKRKGVSVCDDKKVNIDKKINIPAKTTFILDLY